MGTRRATHAGSWYEADTATLGGQLDKWLDDVSVDPTVGTPRAIIAPHAGYVSVCYLCESVWVYIGQVITNG